MNGKKQPAYTPPLGVCLFMLFDFAAVNVNSMFCRAFGLPIQKKRFN